MENQNYRSELAKVRELFKNDRKMSDYLSDENILSVMKSIEIWRKNNTLNPYLEALRVARDSNYWIAYTLLTDEETDFLEKHTEDFGYKEICSLSDDSNIWFVRKETIPDLLEFSKFEEELIIENKSTDQNWYFKVVE